jgi:ATP-dependent exoDNAse (exonuclease V) beta subunit
VTDSVDQARRAEALDPLRSFIVEAPAGSGKTELLIQRYLRLMARVERPEQIVAITFTRKAAAEMRQRVVETLTAAASGSVTVPAHRQASLALAREVLAHAERSGWSILDQPHRLRITTIDALSTSLARQLPVPANGIGGLAVTEKPGGLYALAARRATESLADDDALGDALRRLLQASDNSLAKLDRWLAGVLPQRDGWLRALAAGSDVSFAEQLTASLEQIRRGRLAALRRLISPAHEHRLLVLLTEDPAREPDGAPVDGSIEPDDIVADELWRRAASVLLKRDGDWRQRFTRADGFPAGDKARKQELESLLEVMQATEGLRENLVGLASVPDPADAQSQRDLLPALELVLPRLLAELRVLFEEHQIVDYTELALAAERALGTVDEPSELLLALDRRIEHILVDEFQDTSHVQWRLFEKLTAGWEESDGRTLFLVGDPMQSIYRFRDADLSLFLEAARHGLGSVPLHPITLRDNHRSAPEIVEWVNSTFAGVFPESAAADGGMPPYRPAAATHAPDTSAGVQVHAFADDDPEAETARLVEIVRAELNRDPAQSIGILVRSRNHLKGVRGALKAAGLPARAVEIDSLNDTQLGQDLIGLTMALLHRGDRLSWLGVLRSPWCGLTWCDLLALCGDRKRTVWECIRDPQRRETLSTNGRSKVEWLAARLAAGFDLRAGCSLSQWVRSCWLLLDGPATLANQQALESAERYFATLETLARCGDLDDPAGLRRHFAEPTAGSEASGASGLEIMTMHRAKGLEFDTVLLPALGRLTRGIEDKLLYYQSIKFSDLPEIRLLATASRHKDAIRDYLRAIESRQDNEERGRLLYVAATRARKRLHLIGSVDARRQKPRSGSLLATLWPCLEAVPDIAPATVNVERAEIALVAKELKSLAVAGDLPEPPLPAHAVGTAGDSARPEFQWVNPASVQVGTLIHRELQRLAERAAQAQRPVPPEVDRRRYRRALELLGVEREDLDAAAGRVADALDKVWADPVGRWILKPWPEGWSELRFTLRGPDRLDHVQLDRSFVAEDGTRWIIDYKTGRHLGGDPEAFLDSEVERYREQLELYARVVAETDTRPLRVGLYFPLMGRLRDWEPELAAVTTPG